MNRKMLQYITRRSQVWTGAGVAIFTEKCFTVNNATPTDGSYRKCCNNVTGSGAHISTKEILRTPELNPVTFAG